jgi:hypothetical protein
MAEVKKACRNPEPGAVRDALLGWARARWGAAAPRSLAGIAQQVASPRLKDLLVDLDRSLYAKTKREWSCGELAELLDAEGTAAHTGVHTQPPLPGLYPARS